MAKSREDPANSAHMGSNWAYLYLMSKIFASEKHDFFQIFHQVKRFLTEH